MRELEPNTANLAQAKMEKYYQVEIVTQNIDDFQKRADSTKVTHLHGELLKARSTFNEDLVMDWKKDIKVGDFCEHNYQLRPHVVWFGEAVPMFEKAAEITAKADILIIIGTSMQVYPAAGLIEFAPQDIPVYFIDPKPNVAPGKHLEIISERASIGVPQLVDELIKYSA